MPARDYDASNASFLVRPEMISIRIAASLLILVSVLTSIADAQRRSGNDEDPISFINDVVPIINAKCGKCHVQSTKGRYDIKSYDALMDSDSINLKFPEDSLFIEVIENGKMPKSGLKVTGAEMETLKQWIAEGAKFDGEDESQTISSRGGGNARGSSRGQNSRPSGRSNSRRSSGSRQGSSRQGSSRASAFDSNALLQFLDTNGDGELSLNEIDAAKRLLYSLDRNRDDRLTGDEVRDIGQ